MPVLQPMDLMVEATARRVFSNAHTYHINSISVNSDLQTFISTDDLRVNLWNLEITDRSFSILSLPVKPVWTENTFVRAHQSCHLSTIRAVGRVLNVNSTRESQGCSLMLVSQTLWTSSPPTWRSWRKWSPPQSFTRSSVTPSPTAAARAQYACVTWDRLRSVTNTANVSVSITRVRHEKPGVFIDFLSRDAFQSIILRMDGSYNPTVYTPQTGQDEWLCLFKLMQKIDEENQFSISLYSYVLTVKFGCWSWKYWTRSFATHFLLVVRSKFTCREQTTDNKSLKKWLIINNDLDT